MQTSADNALAVLTMADLALSWLCSPMLSLAQQVQPSSAKPLLAQALLTVAGRTLAFPG